MQNKSFLFAIIICSFFGFQKASGQDSILVEIKKDSIIIPKNDNTYKLNYKYLIAPAVFIGYGVVSLENDALKELKFLQETNFGNINPKKSV